MKRQAAVNGAAGVQQMLPILSVGSFVLYQPSWTANVSLVFLNERIFTLQNNYFNGYLPH